MWWRFASPRTRRRGLFSGALVVLAVSICWGAAVALPTTPIDRFPFDASRGDSKVAAGIAIPEFRTWTFGIEFHYSDEADLLRVAKLAGLGGDLTGVALPIHFRLLRSADSKLVVDETLNTVSSYVHRFESKSVGSFVREIFKAVLEPGSYRIEAATVKDMPEFAGTATSLVVDYNANEARRVASMDHNIAAEIASTEVQKRGGDLRIALHQVYLQLLESNGFKGGFGGTDMTSTVVRFLPIGTPFPEAEDILRSAGFTIGPRPDPAKASAPNRTKDWYVVLASVSPYAFGLLSRYNLYVSLVPKSPGDYTAVSDIRAEFMVSMP